jgi:hypothetical protein
MFGSIIYEHHLLKKEEKQLCERMRSLAERTRTEFGEEHRLPARSVNMPLAEA